MPEINLKEYKESIWLDENDYSRVFFIDQRNIPFQVDILTSISPQETADFIRKMVIRGAPAIGGAGVYGMVQSVVKNSNQKDIQIKLSLIKEDAIYLIKSRPTAVDLKNLVDKMIAKIENEIEKENLIELIVLYAKNLITEIINECKELAETGYQLLHDNMNILHHCNTGPLVIIQGHKKGKKLHVYVDETRPRLQGGRLTAWELSQEKVPHTLIVDTVSATLMKEGKIDLILVGADRIAKNGDFANKIGTYNLAVLAKYHRVEIYSVAPWSTFAETKTGDEIVIEERSAEEVTHIFTEKLEMNQINNNSKVYNPSFDITPHELLTGIIAPGVIIKPPFEKNIAEALRNVKK
jgi:methylthioribose-1-phosphate isomerase